MLHPAFDRHFIAYRTQHVIAAQQAEEIGEGPQERRALVGFGFHPVEETHG
jgi:hypothetical protein